MSLGPNGADSQWVYAHFAATNSVTIKPGFRLAGSASMRISVGSAGGSLPKRGSAHPGDKGAETGTMAMRSELSVTYNPAAQIIAFTLASQSVSRITVSIYDIKGERQKVHVFSKVGESPFSESLSAKDLPKGIYIVQVAAGTKRFQRKFVKW
jgi:hypothetical protein